MTATMGFTNKEQKSALRQTSRGLVVTHDAPKELPKHTELATFAAGCFWGVEQEFRKEHGVIATAVGFMGGKTKNPSYKDVCNHDTGHAEVVQLEFDPSVVKYRQLVELFFNLHDPTTLNRQGPDVGDQYRSAIFFHSPEQKTIAEEEAKKLAKSGELSSTIVTQITSAVDFYKAEEYHQQYVEKGGAAACHFRRHK